MKCDFLLIIQGSFSHHHDDLPALVPLAITLFCSILSLPEKDSQMISDNWLKEIKHFIPIH